MLSIYESVFHWLDVLAISAVYKQTGASALDSNLRFDDFEITSKHEPCILFSCGSLYLHYSLCIQYIRLVLRALVQMNHWLLITLVCSISTWRNVQLLIHAFTEKFDIYREKNQSRHRYIGGQSVFTFYLLFVNV